MSEKAGAYDLGKHYLRLKPDAAVDILPVTEQFWPDLMAGKLGDWKNEYLVTRFEFTEDWPSWEVHPNGDEIVYLLSGAARFLVESPSGDVTDIGLATPGEYVYVPRGCWHTAKIDANAAMLFITPGEGTLNRPV